MPQPIPNRRNMMSVYPPRDVGAVLGGYRSTPFTQGLRCWARVLAEAAPRVEAAFSAAEWEALVRACEGREQAFDPDRPAPGEALAECVERAHAGRRLGEAPGRRGDARAADLAARLRALDYPAAWAVIVAVQWRAARGDAPPGGDPWYTLAARERAAAEKEQP